MVGAVRWGGLGLGTGVQTFASAGFRCTDAVPATGHRRRKHRSAGRVAPWAQQLLQQPGSLGFRAALEEDAGDCVD